MIKARNRGRFDDSKEEPYQNAEVRSTFVMQISRHTPESCPTVDENNKKIMVAQLKKMDTLLAKHGIKLLGSWAEFPMHVVYNIYETPNMEVFLKFSMEPEMAAWLRFNTVETKVVQGRQDVKALLRMK